MYSRIAIRLKSAFGVLFLRFCVQTYTIFCWFFKKKQFMFITWPNLQHIYEENLSSFLRILNRRTIICFFVCVLFLLCLGIQWKVLNILPLNQNKRWHSLTLNKDNWFKSIIQFLIHCPLSFFSQNILGAFLSRKSFIFANVFLILFLT